MAVDQFTVTGKEGAREVRVERVLLDDKEHGRLVLRTSANKPVRLEPDEWPNYLAENIDRRLQARDGQKKGRVLVIWQDIDGRAIRPLAVCAWHVHEGNWPLAIFDAGVAKSVPVDLAVVLRGILVGAVAELAGHEKFADRAVPRPQERVLWRVDRASPGPTEAARKARARAAAARGQQEFGAKRIERKDRPAWARDGFLGRVDVDGD